MTRGSITASEQLNRSEIDRGERFAFGANWRQFLNTVNESRVEEAVRSLKTMLGLDSLAGKRFLDIGSGSGLFSLAAHRLGADVTSFDFDPDSVACTSELRTRFGDTDRWSVLQGSVLSTEFMDSLGVYDVVYSWGVLHHTGAMWQAIDQAVRRVASGGVLFIAIYNDQGAWSSRWRKIKKFYCSGALGRTIVTSTIVPYWIVRGFVADLVWMRNPIQRYSDYQKERGMSVVRDWHDWLGGYPFEVAKPEEILLELGRRNFRLCNLVTAGGSVGCVQYVLIHEHSRDG